MNFHINKLPDALAEPDKSTLPGTLWLPGENFAIHHLPQPTAPKRKWPELIPWLLEEKVLQDVQSMHFVVLGQDENEELITLTVANEDMQHWLNLIADKPLGHYRLLPDFLGLTWQAEHISIAQHDEMIVVRYGEFNGFTAKPQLAWAMVKKILQNNKQQFPILSFIPVSMLPESLQPSAQSRQQGFNWETINPTLTINLFSGKFQRQSKLGESSPLSLDSWWPTTALIAITLALLLSYLGSVNYALRSQLEFTQNQFNNAYSRLFPRLEIAPEGIRSTVEQHLNKRFQQREKLDTPVIKVLAAMDNAISTCSSCSVQTISLSENGGEIVLAGATTANLQQISLPDFHFQAQPQDESGAILLTINRD